MLEKEYKQVLNRIVEFRIKTGKTQTEMSSEFALSQAQLCRLEAGYNRYQVKELKSYVDQGMDIDYVITGEKRRSGFIELLVEQSGLSFGEERNKLLELIIWSMKTELEDPEIELSIEERQRFRKDLEKFQKILNEKQGSIIFRIRSMHDLSQTDMAQKLSVGIKKYRRIEKGQSDMDIELIWNAYRRFRCSPSYLLNGQLENFSVLNELWEYFPLQAKEKISEFVRMGVMLIKQNGNKDSFCG